MLFDGALIWGTLVDVGNSRLCLGVKTLVHPPQALACHGHETRCSLFFNEIDWLSVVQVSLRRLTQDNWFLVWTSILIVF